MSTSKPDPDLVIAFKAAKCLLGAGSPGSGGGRTICLALRAAESRRLITSGQCDKALCLLRQRLNGYPTVCAWLSTQGFIGLLIGWPLDVIGYSIRGRLGDETVQVSASKGRALLLDYRRRWLQSLIEEFS